jgi:hypothetical protein
MPLVEAMKRRDTKLDDLIDEDPATSQAPRWEEPNPARRVDSVREKRRERVQVRADTRAAVAGGSRSSEGAGVANGTSYSDYGEDLGRSASAGSGEEAWATWMDERAPRDSRNHHAKPSQNGVASSSNPGPSSTPNGSSSISHSRGRTSTPVESWDEREGPHTSPQARNHQSPHFRREESWPGQYTGPASGFLQDPRAPFSRTSQNTGRTIYSHQHRPE